MKKKHLDIKRFRSKKSDIKKIASWREYLENKGMTVGAPSEDANGKFVLYSDFQAVASALSVMQDAYNTMLEFKIPGLERQIEELRKANSKLRTDNRRRRK